MRQTRSAARDRGCICQVPLLNDKGEDETKRRRQTNEQRTVESSTLRCLSRTLRTETLHYADGRDSSCFPAFLIRIGMTKEGRYVEYPPFSLLLCDLERKTSKPVSSKRSRVSRRLFYYSPNAVKIVPSIPLYSALAELAGTNRPGLIAFSEQP